MSMIQQNMMIAERYRLLHALRRGGMSEVFLAFDEQAQHEVAVKLVACDTLDNSRRLQREVTILRALSHPHILPLLDNGNTGAYCYLVMPYMRRGNLRERLARERMSLHEAGNVLVQLTDALQCAHEQGIVHRDIKPSNVLLDTVDENYVYLADFGLAKALDAESDITKTGCLIGTPQYMAPELADMPYSIGSDIYALGIMLYQMLTGQLPFTGSDPLAICWKHVQEQPQPPSNLNPHISQAVEQVILRALDKNPQQRFPDAQAMALAYTNALRANDKQHAGPVHVTLSLPAVQVTLRKKEEVVTLAGRWLYDARKARRKLTVSLSMVALMALPLSLGLLLGRNFEHISTPLQNSDTVLGNSIAASPAKSREQHAHARDTVTTQQTDTDKDDAASQATPVSGPNYTPQSPRQQTPVNKPKHISTPTTVVSVVAQSTPPKSPGRTGDSQPPESPGHTHKSNPSKVVPKPRHRPHQGNGKHGHINSLHKHKKTSKGKKRG